jgi:hypothetical protein
VAVAEVPRYAGNGYGEATEGGVEMSKGDDDYASLLDLDPDDIGLQEYKDALQREKLEVDTEIGDIRDQIRDAKGRAAATGVYSDRDWYRRVHGALRIRSQQSQEIQLRLGEVNRRIKSYNAATHTQSPCCPRCGEPCGKCDPASELKVAKEGSR